MLDALKNGLNNMCENCLKSRLFFFRWHAHFENSWMSKKEPLHVQFSSVFSNIPFKSSTVTSCVCVRAPVRKLVCAPVRKLVRVRVRVRVCYVFRVLVPCVGPVCWSRVLDPCLCSVHWSRGLVPCVGPVYWFRVLVPCVGSVCWFRVLVPCVGSQCWFR